MRFHIETIYGRKFSSKSIGRCWKNFKVEERVKSILRANYFLEAYKAK